MAFQKQINQFLARGVEGEYADDSPRRESGYILMANVTAGAAATGKLAFAANPSDGDTVTIGSVTYRFETTLAQANDVKIGAVLADTLASLEKTVNGEGISGTDYYADTVTPLTDVIATVNGNALDLTAQEEGVSGNAIALASSAANVTVTAFAGGVDEVSVLPQIACAFTETANGDGVAQVGGEGLFAGILVNPKQFANYMGLNPTLSIPSGIQGGLCTFGHVYVKPASSFQIGFVAAFDKATGKINAYANESVVPSGMTLIKNARFIKYAGDANTVAVLELGN